MERLSVFERDEIVSAIEKEVMDKFGKQSQEIIRLKDDIGELKAAGNLVISDMVTLLENQRMNPEDGSYLVDGQSCHELNILINKES